MKVDGGEWLTLGKFILAIKAVDTVIKRFVGGIHPYQFNNNDIEVPSTHMKDR
jgi:hypothetical protein